MELLYVRIIGKYRVKKTSSFDSRWEMWNWKLVVKKQQSKIRRNKQLILKQKHYKENSKSKTEERQEFSDTIQHILSAYTSRKIELYFIKKYIAWITTN